MPVRALRCATKLLSRVPIRRSTAGVALVVLMMASVGSAASNGSTAHKTIKPDFAFFAGKTITFIVPNTPGSSYANTILPVLPFVQNELHATINLVYMSSGGSIVGQDTIAGSVPDALTIGFLSVSSDLAQALSGAVLINFSLLKQSLIVGNNFSPEIIVACNGSPYTSIYQVLNLKTPFSVINTGKGPGYEVIKVLFNAYESPVKSLSGYISTAAQTAACLAGGDAPLALQDMGSLTPASFSSGNMKGLLLTTPPSKSSQLYPYVKNVPTIAQLLKKLPPKSPGGKVVLPLLQLQTGGSGIGTVIAGPAGIPKARILALQEAFVSAFKQGSVKASMLSSGLVPGYVPASSIAPYMRKLLRHQTIISRFINS